MIRILSKRDKNLFFSALDFYYETTNHFKSGYLPEDRKKWINMHKDFFSSISDEDYVVVGDIIENNVIGLAIGFKYGLIFGEKHVNLLSSWHLAFTWKHEKNWATPKKYIFDITNPISLHMENKFIFDFTKIMRINISSAIEMNAAHYLHKIFDRNIPDGRYNSYLESIVRDKNDLDKLSKSQRIIYPENIITPLMCVKHSLKNEIRAIYLK